MSVTTITGTPGNDRILPSGVSAGVVGGVPGALGSLILALAGNDTVEGGAGADTMDGAEGDDILEGGAGDDVLRPGVGAFEQLEGGPGRDAFLIDGPLVGRTIYILDIAPEDRVDVSRLGLPFLGSGFAFPRGPGITAIDFAVFVHADADDVADIAILLFGNATGWNIGETSLGSGVLALQPPVVETAPPGGATLRGNASRDTLTGDAGNDTLFGAGANDTLTGGGGNDLLDGGTEFDTMIGGAGDGTFWVGARSDAVLEAPGEGRDTVFVTATGFAAPNHVEVAHLAGNAAELGGNEDANVLVGNPGRGSFPQGAGGNDTLWGTAHADALWGQDGDDTLRSQGGADQMEGGRGDDTFVVFDPRATAFEGAGQGFDTVWANVGAWTAEASSHVELIRLLVTGRVTGNDLGQTMSAHAADTTLDGAGGNDTLWGDDSRNVLLGGAGDDVLRGLGGGDVLSGGAGRDQMDGGKGADRFVFDLPAWSDGLGGRDQIFGFVRGQDTLDFRGSGVATLAGLIVEESAGNTQLVSRATGAAVDLYGVIGLTAADFLF